MSTQDTHNEGYDKGSSPSFYLNFDDEKEINDLCHHLESKNIFPEIGIASGREMGYISGVA